MATVSVRYIVHDVDAAIEFYCSSLGFRSTCTQPPASRCSPAATSASCSVHPGPARGEAARPCRTAGARARRMEPVPARGVGPAALVETLRGQGATFRNDIVEGVGGKQILLEDPSGNPVELFEPTLPEAAL